jgi:hypothetical protein
MNTLTEKQRTHFAEEGYILIQNLLNVEQDIRPVFDEYTEVLNQLAHQLHQQGEIALTYNDLPFGKRLVAVYRDSGQVHSQYFDCSLPQGTQADSPIWVGPQVFYALRNHKVLDVLEDLIGPEVFSNPVQHIRIKPPQDVIPNPTTDPLTGFISGFDVGATPWHQDNGVVLPEADETDMITVWLPLTEAAVENGCLQIIPRSHKAGLLHHCSTPFGHRIKNEWLDLDNQLACPMSPGDVLFLHRRTCHSSLPNLSDDVRISFDLRYNPTGQSTGRDVYPGFVARSRSQPATEQHDPTAWAQDWYDTRARLAIKNIPTYNRWGSNDPLCA